MSARHEFDAGLTDALAGHTPYQQQEQDGTRRTLLLAAIKAHGRPVTTQLAARLLTGMWPTYGRNTARKDLRALVGRGHLTAVDLDSRRVYHPITREDGRP